MLKPNQMPAGSSIVDPPGVEPAIALSVPTLHGKQLGFSVDLATARDIIRELNLCLTTIERWGRG